MAHFHHILNFHTASISSLIFNALFNARVTNDMKKETFFPARSSLIKGNENQWRVELQTMMDVGNERKYK